MAVAGGFGAVWTVLWIFDAAPGHNRWLGGWALFAWCLLMLGMGMDLLWSGRGILQSRPSALGRAENVLALVSLVAALGVAGTLSPALFDDSVSAGQWLPPLAGCGTVFALAMTGMALCSAKATQHCLGPQTEDPLMAPVAAELADGASLGAQVAVLQIPHETIHIHAHGAVFFYGHCAHLVPGKGKTFAVRWQDIERIDHSFSRVRHQGTTYEFGYRYCLWHRGTRHRMTAGAAAPVETALTHFVRLAEPKIAEAQLPRMLERLRQGGTVDFKLAAITPEGLLLHDWLLFVKRRTLMTWAELDHIEVGPQLDLEARPRGIVVHTRSGEQRRAMWEPNGIPNRMAFLAVLEHFGVDVRETQPR
ncbi:hypothetical protein [Streptomyces sp. WM6378]|uniref:hypothetical protein n=1 Tax=Streptomyces sp. WM6378 TaxID=1415557 RepID=UPI0006ADDF59|nr:hypothetical protein [Streptomyces sp. WM6378]KOU35536.1 hypothetical protein ADK54_37205 [Streptomyces sp. WM6378]